MAWNRLSGAPKVAPKKKPSAMRGIVAGLVVVCALGGLCLWMFSGGEDAPKVKPDKERGLIKEVKPAASPKYSEETKKSPKIELKDVGDGRVMKYVDGEPVWLYPRRNDEAKWGIRTQDLRQTWAYQHRQAEDRLFDNSADRLLAYLYNAEPGEEIGDGISTKNFAKRFLRAIRTPIIVHADEPEAEKNIKRGVIELRKELKARYDAGEDIEAVINATRDELTRQNQYRAELLREIERNAKNKNLTEAEAQDFYDAANLMLESRGLKNVEMSGIIKRKIERNRLQREKKKQQTEGE